MTRTTAAARNQAARAAQAAHIAENNRIQKICRMKNRFHTTDFFVKRKNSLFIHRAMGE